MASKKEVEVAKQGGALVSALHDTGVSGFEDVSSSAYSIPFLKLLQSNSPQCKRSDGAYVDGASEGMIMHTISEQLFKAYEEPLKVIPVTLKESINEWVPQPKGGGLVAVHPIGSDVKRHATWMENEDGKRILRLPNGNDLVDTANHHVLFWNGEDWEPAVLSCTSTNLTFSRKWMSHMGAIKMVVNGQKVRRPMFGNIYNISTVAKTKDKLSWYVFDFERVGDLDDESLIPVAVDYIKAIDSGVAQMDMSQAERVDPETGEVIENTSF